MAVVEPPPALLPAAADVCQSLRGAVGGSADTGRAETGGSSSFLQRLPAAAAAADRQAVTGRRQRYRCRAGWWRRRRRPPDFDNDGGQGRHFGWRRRPGRRPSGLGCPMPAPVSRRQTVAREVSSSSLTSIGGERRLRRKLESLSAVAMGLPHRRFLTIVVEPAAVAAEESATGVNRSAGDAGTAGRVILIPVF